MKKYLISLILFFTLFLLNAQDLKVQFLKGSLTEKTKVVREATVTEGKWITQNALKFIHENKNILINDRDFEGFTVATVLSIQNEYVTNLNEEEKNILINQLSQFFVDFDYSDTVQISILSKVSTLKDCLSIQPFVNVINEYISDLKNKSSKTNVINVVLDSLNQIGDNNSFKILYNCLFEKQLSQYYPQIESVVVNLIPISMNEVLQLVYCKNFVHIEKIFTLINKNDKDNKNKETIDNMKTRGLNTKFKIDGYKIGFHFSFYVGDTLIEKTILNPYIFAFEPYFYIYLYMLHLLFPEL